MSRHNGDTMKAALPIIGILLMGLAWIIAQYGRYSDNLTLVLCTVPIAALALATYFYAGKPKRSSPPPSFTKEERLKGEGHLPEWVVRTRREMERNARQSRPKG